MQKIIEYIKSRYDPLSLIVYGSFADGSNNEHSDFDALAVIKEGEKYHDVSFVGDIQLDLFVYPVSYFKNDFDCAEILQIFDGKIVFDSEDTGKKLKEMVKGYLESLPYKKTPEENREQVEWCKKMLLRAKRGDTEGLFRWHWLLTESLEIYFDLLGKMYFGPKKSIGYMKQHLPEAFEKYNAALQSLDYGALESWIEFLDGIAEKSGK